MKYLFIVISVGLVAASALTFVSFSEKQDERPVLRWMTGMNPVREEQADLFERWMEENGYPSVDLRIEGPKKTQKNIIQGVSGVAGDIFDCYYGEINLFQSIGLLEDVTDAANEMGFGLTETYRGVWSDLTVDGRQYGFPRCVDTFVSWVNVEAFERVGLSSPPAVWTFDEFERIGKSYVELSNRPGEHQTVYFSTQWGLFSTTMLLRSMGVDVYNETMTGSNLDAPQAKDLYRMIYRWINDLNLIPTAAESQALSSRSSRTDKGVIYLFSQGNFGMIFAGRYATIYFREVGPKKLSISEFPHKSYRNAVSFSRSAAVYKGSKHKNLAVYFLKFMASHVYNKEIAEYPDGLPPSPKFAYGEAFSHPVEYPYEWSLHDQIRDVVNEIGISFSYSPFLQMNTLIRYERDAMNSLLADRISVEQALDGLANTIKKDMVRFTNESERMKAKYEKQLQNQKEIEKLRREGELVPLHLISNPFYRKYYVDQGWSLPEG